MSLSYDIADRPDSLQLLLQKAFVMKTINQENLDYIYSRKGQKVVTGHERNHDTFTFVQTRSKGRGKGRVLSFAASGPSGGIRHCHPQMTVTFVCLE